MTRSQALLSERVPVARREPEVLVYCESPVDNCGLSQAAPSRSESLGRLRDNAQHHTLAWWAVRYLTTKVCDVQSVNTLEAKARDLDGFVRWFIATHGSGAIDTWLPRDTRTYLTELERQGRAPPTINRALSSLRHMARWVHDQPGAVFARTGLPTEGIRELAVDEPDASKLDRSEVLQLFAAADALVLTETRKNARPRRNRAILALLLCTGLRVSELVGLRRDQFDGKYLLTVKRKGCSRTPQMYVATDGRRALEDYLANERPKDELAGTATALFLATQPKGRGITRRAVGLALEHLAQEASRGRDEKLHVHPHQLRHTFGSLYRARTGSDTETAAALGHAGLKYVGRYVRKTQQEREAVLEGLCAFEDFER